MHMHMLHATAQLKATRFVAGGLSCQLLYVTAQNSKLHATLDRLPHLEPMPRGMGLGVGNMLFETLRLPCSSDGSLHAQAPKPRQSPSASPSAITALIQSAAIAYNNPLLGSTPANQTGACAQH